MQIKLKNVRLSFPDLLKARAGMDGGEPRFGASFLLHKQRNAEEIKAVKAAIAKVMAEKKWPQQLVKSVCLVEATTKVNSKTGAPLDGYDADHMVINAKAKNRPALWNAVGAEIDEMDNPFYAGCYVHAAIEIYPYDKVAAHGKRVCAGILAVRFFKDGEPFGSSAPKDSSILDFGDSADLM